MSVCLYIRIIAIYFSINYALEIIAHNSSDGAKATPRPQEVFYR